MMRIVAVAALVLSLFDPRPANALQNDELLALVAMPLAVAAVSDITEVPVNQLIDVVTLLNDANVPPVQFVEVVRYVPVALVEEREDPLFVSWLRSRYDLGLRDFALVSSIEERYGTYELRDLDFDRPQPRILEVVESPGFIPQVVRTRVAARSSHPHGGPPGQLKKQLGVQTGAEVVHRNSPRGNSDDPAIRVIDRNDDKAKPDGRDKANRKNRDERDARARASASDGNRGKNQLRASGPRNDEKARSGGRGKSGNNVGRGNSGNGGDKGNGKGKGKGKN